MDLTRFAFGKPHVLLIEAPGGTGPRLAVERLARERGWPLVDTPADADVLVVAGAGLHEPAQLVWDQLPGPRTRITLLDPDRVEAALDEAARSLLDRAEQRADAAARGPRDEPMQEMGGDSGHDMSAEDGDGGSGDDMGGDDMGGDDGGGGSGHDMHGGHDMGGGDMPAGLPMADRAPDRDGLELDILHVPWGPALPWWPAGLVVRIQLQGDVLSEVEVGRIGPTAPAAPFWQAAADAVGSGRAAAAARIDALTRLLAVAGWSGERLRAQRVRDGLLGGAPNEELVGQLERLERRVGRSALLRRMTAALGPSAGARVTEAYRGWLADAGGFRDGPPASRTADAQEAADQLADLLTGAEWSTGRLIVASLDPELTGALQPGAHRV